MHASITLAEGAQDTDVHGRRVYTSMQQGMGSTECESSCRDTVEVQKRRLGGAEERQKRHGKSVSLTLRKYTQMLSRAPSSMHRSYSIHLQVQTLQCGGR